MVDITVLRRGAHGMPMDEYAAALRERLPDREVALARTPGEERALVADARVVTGSAIDEELLAVADELELFACSYAGYGHLPMDAFHERGVAVTNAAGIHAPSIAEQVLGYLLTFARDLHEGWRRKQNREWRHYQARELGGSTVTVVGMGAIGHAVVERLQGFDVDTIGVRYTPEKGGPTDEVVGFEEEAFHGALARTDYLVLATPLTDTTRGLVDEAAFQTLPGERARERRSRRCGGHGRAGRGRPAPGHPGRRPRRHRPGAASRGARAVELRERPVDAAQRRPHARTLEPPRGHPGDERPAARQGRGPGEQSGLPQYDRDRLSTASPRGRAVRR